MHCSECDLLVETEVIRKHDEWGKWDEHYWGDLDYNGDYPPQKTGEVVKETEKREWTVGTRIDLCANCGHTLEVRTFLR